MSRSGEIFGAPLREREMLIPSVISTFCIDIRLSSSHATTSRMCWKRTHSKAQLKAGSRSTQLRISARLVEVPASAPPSAPPPALASALACSAARTNASNKSYLGGRESKQGERERGVVGGRRWDGRGVSVVSDEATRLERRRRRRRRRRERGGRMYGAHEDARTPRRGLFLHTVLTTAAAHECARLASPRRPPSGTNRHPLQRVRS